MKAIKLLIIISGAISIILGVNLLVYMFTPSNMLQNYERVEKSLYMKPSPKIDLKSAQITHLDGTPIKLTLSAYNYSFLGTTGGSADILNSEINIGYNNPDNATPTVKATAVLHELFHIADGHYNLIKQKCRKDGLDRECMELKAYDFEHLYLQLLELEDSGWFIIERK